MSSSNRLSLVCIPESTYNVTPPTGTWLTIRNTSESITGSPQTVESAEARADRQVGGQVSTGLELSGGFDFELSTDASIKLFIEQAMMSDKAAAVTSTGTLTIAGSAGTVTTTATLGGIKTGDVVELSGFSNAANNGIFYVVLSEGQTTMTVVGAKPLVDEASAATAKVTRHPYWEIGTVLKSVSISKEFLDVGTPVRSIAYTGMRTTSMDLSFAFGQIITGSFGLAGAGYSTPTNPITTGGTITPAGSDIPLDASNGMGWVVVDGEVPDICIENLSIALNNNVEAQNCIGHLAPTNQVPFSAGINIEMSMYLGENSFDMFMPKKLTQEPIAVHFYTTGFDGKGYAVSIPRVQLSFPDPAGSGRDSHVMLPAAGTGSYDAAFGNSLRIYALEGVA